MIRLGWLLRISVLSWRAVRTQMVNPGRWRISRDACKLSTQASEKYRIRI